MPKKAPELSARAVAALKQDGRHAVGGVACLYLTIEGNARSWILRITVNGKRRELGLGSFPEVSLAQARDTALDLRRAKHALAANQRLAAVYGRLAPSNVTPPADPAGGLLTASGLAPPSQPVPAPKPTRHTFRTCAPSYIETQAPGWKSQKHAAQWSSTLETYAYPVIGDRDVATIETSHLVSILKPIWYTKTETATRVRGRIEAVLDWCEHRGYRHGKNPAAWDGNLEPELASPTKLKKRKQRHHPALPYTRMGAFMVDLRLREGASARALEWAILNASRFQEVSGARRREVDLQLRRWTIPAERMKREIEHVVPLSDEAITLYNSFPAGSPDDLLFPAPEGGELSDAALGAMIDAIHEADIARGGLGYMDPKEGRIATQHGFRSTFRDWAAEITYVDREIIEHAIAHKLKDKAEAAYQRGTLLLKRAELMTQWGRFCRTPEFQVKAIPAQASHPAPVAVS